MSKIKIKTHKAIVPLYPVTIKYSSVKDAFNKEFDIELNERTAACIIYNEELQPLTVAMYIPHEDYSVNIPDLAHEAFHAAMLIADMVGVEIELRSNEAVAYLISWITEWILNCVGEEFKLSEANNG